MEDKAWFAPENDFIFNVVVPSLNIVGWQLVE